MCTEDYCFSTFIVVSVCVWSIEKAYPKKRECIIYVDDEEIARIPVFFVGWAFPNALLSGAAPRNSNYTKNIFFNKKFLITSD